MVTLRLNQRSNHEIRESFDIWGTERSYPDDQVPGFGEAVSSLENECKIVVQTIYRLLAISFGMDDKNFFVNNAQYLEDHRVSTLCTMRVLYYPPIPKEVPVGAVRCPEHCDYGFLTLLFQDMIGGLQVDSNTI